MTRGDSDQRKADEHQRLAGAGAGGEASSRPPDRNSAHVPHAEKLEKDLKAGQDAPVEQHRSSRRPRERQRRQD